ncbi:substrate-binding protein [Gillisia sp. Hel1_33_143]|uniref:ABC transporter substrate-binding protein n=1 Tax=Gillisia sp. Hel1_33_143 TaxID=1336796 RepID=UPI000879BDAE|nr:helical backbone metal receptor [Gillisia sp. Hel1_33_143]SDS20424.1 substrate-binding protein [Gillisia sp. Hel1_33_143]
MKDQLGRLLDITQIPKRIISLVPSQTELLCTLGLTDSIVGITKFCVHPEGLKTEKKIVGGTKNVHFNKIADLKPDIILCNKEENTKEMVFALEKIAPVHISNVITLEDTYQLILQYGEIFNRTMQASHLVNSIQYKKGELNIDNRIKKVVYLIWKDPWMAVGGNTFINSMLELNNCDNVFKNSTDRYPVLTLEMLKELDIDIVLLSSEPYPFKEKHISDLIKLLNTNTILVNGEYFSWYGSRLLNAFDYFKTIRWLNN